MEHFKLSIRSENCGYALSPNSYFIRCETTDSNGDGKLNAGDQILIKKENLDDGESWSETRILSGDGFSSAGLERLINDILQSHQANKSAVLEGDKLSFRDVTGDEQARVDLASGIITFTGCR